MTNLTYAQFMEGIISVKEHDKRRIEKLLKYEIELFYDEFGRVFTVDGEKYVADLEVESI